MNDHVTPLFEATKSDKGGSDIILERMMQLHPKIIDLSLDRVYDLLEKLGNPHKNLPPVIHVAGTNGKGSTIAYLRAILEAKGLGVHVYTSPHLVRFHERIRLNNQEGQGSHLISEADLCLFLNEVEKVNAGIPITYFEVTTVSALLAFSRLKADVLLLEVGLGGRMDATNVIDDPLVSVITPISIDHVQFLGDSIEKIAAEKAGIIKKKCPVVVASQEEGARDVIANIARRLASPCAIAGEDWHVYEENGHLIYQDEKGLLDLPMPNLRGSHQISNAGTAIAALRMQDKFEISDEAYENGVLNASWPARLQQLKEGAFINAIRDKSQSDFTFWLDGGHNPGAAIMLADFFTDKKQQLGQKIILVTGMINTKDAQSYFKHLQGVIDEVYTCTIPNEVSAIPANDLAKIAQKSGLSTKICENIDALPSELAIITQPAQILFAGSLYFAGAILRANGDALN